MRGIITCALLAISSSSAMAQVFGCDVSMTMSDLFSNGGFTNGPQGVFNGGSTYPIAAGHITGPQLDADGLGPWDRGSVSALAVLSGALNNPTAPTLHARAVLSGMHSNTAPWWQTGYPIAGAGFSQANALETYQYTGASPMTMSLTYDLHGAVNHASYDPSLMTGIRLSFGVVSNVTDYSTDISTLVYEMGAQQLSSGGVAARASLSMTDTNGLFQVQSATVFFDLVPGQVFSVASRLSANAVGGTNFADAGTTATGTFSNPELISSLAVPASGSLGALALFGLGAARRRR